jgi:putative PIN family toxin of toxin-antitoxin system
MTSSQTPPCIVLDTNAVLDWLVFGDGGMASIAAAISTQKIHWLASPPMWDELARVLAYPLIAARNPDLTQLQARWQKYAHMIETPPTAAPLLCKDADDQKFLDLAFASKAVWLISKDKALLTLHKKAQLHGLAISRPEHWVASLHT